MELLVIPGILILILFLVLPDPPSVGTCQHNWDIEFFPPQHKGIMTGTMTCRNCNKRKPL